MQSPPRWRVGDRVQLVPGVLVDGVEPRLYNLTYRVIAEADLSDQVTVEATSGAVAGPLRFSSSALRPAP